MKTQLTGILLMLVTLTSCVKETLKECPTGNVRIDLYVEKFQTNSAAPTEDAEEIFNQRIQVLNCVLYKDHKYVMDTTISNVSMASQPYFTIFLPDLEFGNYEMVVIANSDPTLLKGDFHIPGDRNITYPGVDKMKDLFATNLEFTLNCNCTEKFQAKLRRLEGVIHLSFRNLPTDIQEAEVTIHGVNSNLGIDGYTQSIDVIRRFPMNILTGSRDPGMSIGVFPTTKGSPATFRLKLFKDSGNVAVYDEVAKEPLNIVRNQLVELLIEFSNGNLSFEIKIDTLWEDLINGGEIEVP